MTSPKPPKSARPQSSGKRSTGRFWININAMAAHALCILHHRPGPRLQHRPAGGKVSGPSPLNTSRLGSEREIEVVFSPCASNWRGIGVCLPPMLSIARCSLNEPLRGTS